jgi:hypothetical protein
MDVLADSYAAEEKSEGDAVINGISDPVEGVIIPISVKKRWLALSIFIIAMFVDGEFIFDL